MRISDRIAQNYLAGEAQPIQPELNITADEVKVHYFEGGANENEGTEIKTILFAPDGTLANAWPEGFFNINDISTLSRVRLFSENFDLLEDTRKQIPWVDRFAPVPEIRNWILCAATASMIDDMYTSVFPLYTQRIAEQLIVDKLLDPFKSAHKLDLSDVNFYKDKVGKYLSGKGHPPSLGQCVVLLKQANRGFSSGDPSYVTVFRKEFLRNLPDYDKALWTDPKFYGRLDVLANVRNSGSHGGGGTLDKDIPERVRGIHDLLIINNQPGILLQVVDEAYLQ